eukprot:Skav207243  [mRNA]  locus=scaffold523:477791:485726:- [translate_table: standard]
MDRSFSAFISLPFFDDTFRSRVSELKLDHVEFWLAMTDDNDSLAEEKLSNMLPALTKDHLAKDDMLQRLDMVNTLAELVQKSQARVQQEIATDLGYGSVELAHVGTKRSSAVLEGQFSSPTPNPILKPSGPGPQGKIPSLQSVEDQERKKWGLRLQKICDRAGQAAGVNDPKKFEGMGLAEIARIKTMTFEGGGHRTIRQNVRAWEKFEEWCGSHQLTVYPPSMVAIMRYCLHVRDQGCGPAVLPAFKYAVGWICKKLIMKAPNLADPHLKSVVDKVHEERGKELKEAIPVPPKLVIALEHYLKEISATDRTSSALTVWWILILIYASLRFDDGVHVAPSSLEITDESMLGVVWQTKVERKRKGTRFAVPSCSLSGIEWLPIGWELFQPFRQDRDFFIWDMKDEKEFSDVPITYTRGMSWMKFLFIEALRTAAQADMVALKELKELEQIIQMITWHSMRVTFLSEAVKANVDDKIVGLQANWKDPKQLVLKYARQRKELSVAMVKEVSAKLREKWDPKDNNLEIDEEEEGAVNDPFTIEYIVKSSLPKKALESSDFRCHIFDRSVNVEASICGKLKMSDASSVGIMVDRTTYADEAHTPKIALRQIFGRLGLRTELCRAAADSGLLNVEVFAMLGDSAAASKTALRTLIAEATLGANNAEIELALMQLAAVWHSCHALQGQFATRRARMEEDPNKVPEMAQEDHAEFRARFVRSHPDVILLDAKEPHKKFVEKLNRDFLVNGMAPYYPVAEIRTRADSIVQKSDDHGQQQYRKYTELQ